MIELKTYAPEAEAVLAGYVTAFFGVHHSDVSAAEAKQTLADWTKDGGKLFSILSDGSTVGFIRMHNTSPTVCWIDDIFVDEAHRGRGIASEAIHQAECEMRRLGTRSFCMEVVPDNLPALRLYHKLGYDRLSLITVRKDDDPFETERTETIGGFPLRVKKFE